MEMHRLPRVSFIIPTLNAAHILPRCLQAIREQNYPQEKVEIVMADANSQDQTRAIGRQFNARMIDNPEILHEPGKDRAAQVATGEIFFFTDADNILSHPNWLREMVQPYLDYPEIMGFLPQTVPAPDSNSLDRYLGYLCTDPLTWFVYGNASSGRDFSRLYRPVSETSDYSVYKFFPMDPPMFGLSQGVGTSRKFQRGPIGHADDLLAGVKLIEEGGLIAYVPRAGVYHYHVDGFKNYLRKYAWRVKNNLSQQVEGMGLVNRIRYFSWRRQWKIYLFLPYALSMIFPAWDALRLVGKHKDWVMLWHLPATLSLALVILYERGRFLLAAMTPVGRYE